MENPNKELVIMVGIQGSGKSTYVDKHLVGKYQVLCIDDIRRAFGDIYNYRTEPIIRSIVDTMLRAYMERELSIVIDGINVSIHIIKKFEKIAEEYGYKTRFIFMDLPIEICKQKLGINKLTEEVYERAIENLNESRKYLEEKSNNIEIIKEW